MTCNERERGWDGWGESPGRPQIGSDRLLRCLVLPQTSTQPTTQPLTELLRHPIFFDIFISPPPPPHPHRKIEHPPPHAEENSYSSLPTSNALLIDFRLSSDADVLSISTEWACKVSGKHAKTCVQRVRVPTELPCCIALLLVGLDGIIIIIIIIIISSSLLLLLDNEWFFVVAKLPNFFLDFFSPDSVTNDHHWKVIKELFFCVWGGGSWSVLPDTLTGGHQVKLAKKKERN